MKKRHLLFIVLFFVIIAGCSDNQITGSTVLEIERDEKADNSTTITKVFKSKDIICTQTDSIDIIPEF